MEHWKPEDVQGGLLVSKRRSEMNPHFQVPCIVSSAEGGAYSLVSLADGYRNNFESKEALAEWLNKYGYFQVPKMIFKGGMGDLPENRIGTPVLAVSNCDY